MVIEPSDRQRVLAVVVHSDLVGSLTIVDSDEGSEPGSNLSFVLDGVRPRELVTLGASFAVQTLHVLADGEPFNAELVVLQVGTEGRSIEHIGGDVDAIEAAKELRW